MERNQNYGLISQHESDDECRLAVWGHATKKACLNYHSEKHLHIISGSLANVMISTHEIAQRSFFDFTDLGDLPSGDVSLST